jgi:hypothetical protein
LSSYNAASIAIPGRSGFAERPTRYRVVVLNLIFRRRIQPPMIYFAPQSHLILFVVLFVLVKNEHRGVA